jgi:hypothetical protein
MSMNRPLLRSFQFGAARGCRRIMPMPEVGREARRRECRLGSRLHRRRHGAGFAAGVYRGGYPRKIVVVDFDTVADELYALTPEEFTAARTAREKEARAHGDRELAERIHALAKPSVVAWLANQLVRERADEIGPLLELGGQLREATVALQGDALRALSQQRHQIIYALVQQARAIASAAGHRVSEDTARGLEQTLSAALADETTGQRLASGRLTEGLQPDSFGLGDQTPAPAATGTAAGRRPALRPTSDEQVEQRRAALLQRAEQDTTEAQAAADTAQRERDQADTELTDVTRQREQAAGRVDDLRMQLDEAMHDQLTAERAERRARTSLDRADRSSREAQRRLREATDRRDRLRAEAGE